MLKKTLRKLLEVEIYVQRNLKHPAMNLLSDSLIAKLKDQNEMDKEQLASLSASVPQVMQVLQMLVVQEVLPEKADDLDKEFLAVLDELSTVEPLLAYKISERHIISPIQKLNTFPVEILHKLGVQIKEEEFGLINQIAEKIKEDWITESLDELRADIENVAKKIGRQMSREIGSHYEDADKIRRDSIEKMTDKLFEFIPKEAKNHIEPTKSQS